MLLFVPLVLLLPWRYQVSEQTADHVSVHMSFTDNIDATALTPSKFNYGNTGLQCDATVTLYRDRSSVDMAVQLTNTRSNDINYEYWTCTTLAPGSDPANPKATGNTEIIAPISQIQKRLFPWQLVGAIVMSVSGLVLFYAQPILYWGKGFYWIKMLVAMPLAMLNLIVFHYTTYRSVAEWDTAASPPLPRRRRRPRWRARPWSFRKRHTVA